VALIRILIVDDFLLWRSEVISILERNSEFQIIGEASDGLEAVHKSAELQPDLILLDVGLPKLNGIEAARQILEIAPGSKIAFLSENSFPELVQEALKLGAKAYIIKSEAASDLLPAVKAVLEGRQFVSSRLAGCTFPSTPVR